MHISFNVPTWIVILSAAVIVGLISLVAWDELASVSTSRSASGTGQAPANGTGQEPVSPIEVMQNVLALIAAAGALLNGLFIARLSGRVMSLEAAERNMFQSLTRAVMSWVGTRKDSELEAHPSGMSQE